MIVNYKFKKMLEFHMLELTLTSQQENTKFVAKASRLNNLKNYKQLSFADIIGIPFPSLTKEGEKCKQKY